ncbi:MAG: SDR family NAD(P)-dependent oxidoreductase [Vulcanimicrobiota bacterium]
MARECQRRGGQTLAVPTDVSRPEQVEARAGAAMQRFGHIDVWINNAGVSALGRFEDVPVADHHS